MGTQKFHTIRYALKKCTSKRHGWAWKPWTLPGTCCTEARMLLVLPSESPTTTSIVCESQGDFWRLRAPQQGWSPGSRVRVRTVKPEILTKDSSWCIFSAVRRDLGLTLKITSSLGRKLSSFNPLAPAHSILSEIMGFQEDVLCAHDTEGRWCIHLRIKPVLSFLHPSL